ncbi:MAG: glycerol-3-phosphate 1-O-acyltransferase PlsY [Gemmatimonadetes bacterium]|nr:glycerol-3-phosphate 1-O-acyltransferase PlsY [Gemmatimonadota bacterium]
MGEGGRWLGLVVAYLGGSTPFAYLAGRLLRGIDLREHGSGNLGATNVLRTLGAGAAVVVLLLDAAKGAVPVLFFREWFAGPPGVWWPALFGVAAITGHVRPYLGVFRGGGKGVATAAGVFAALSPTAMAVALLVFAVLVAATRYVSVGSIGAGLVLAITSAVLYGPTSVRSLLALLVAGFVVFTHRANIGRLQRGEESRLGAPAAGAR